MDKIAKIDAQILKAETSYDIHSKKRDAAWEKLRDLQNKRGDLLLEQYKGEDFFPEILLTPNLPQSMWKEQRRQWSVLGIATSGYNPKTYQNNPRIDLTKEDDAKTEAQYQAVCKLLPFLKFDDGVKTVYIMERTLSAGGIYYIHVHEDGASDLLCMCYHNESILKSFPNLREAMTYVQKNHWYQSSEPRNDYDDDDDNGY